MNKIEILKGYIQDQISEKGFDQNGDLSIDHSGLAEHTDIILAASELGYFAFPSCDIHDGEGISYVSENDSDWRVFDCSKFRADDDEIKFIAIIVNDKTKEAMEAILDGYEWETDFSYPSTGVNSFDVAEALDFDGAKKAGYRFIEN